MVKQVTYTYAGMNQDVTKSKHPFQFYFKGNNIRILATNSQSSYSITNELGNSLEITIPAIEIDIDANSITYGNKTLNYYQGSTIPEIESQILSGSMPISSNSQKIIGYSVTRNSIVLFTTDNKGFDCVWEIEELLEGNYELSLLYCRNLGLSDQYPIQTLFNYENEIIQKVYWVDSKKQLRFINTKHSIENGDVENLIDLNSNTINIVGNFNLNQPIVTTTVSGGNHTAGMIQYAYNLYRLNSSQTKISPLSELESLDKGSNLGGGAVNEVVGTIPVVSITDIDPEYTHLKLYAIKYTSYNQSPQISIIADVKIDSSYEFTYFDDGGIISDITTEEFQFLGSDIVIPRHIESKDNILFSANIKEVSFDVDIDCRAFSHTDSGGGIVYDNVRPSPSNAEVPIGNPYFFTDTNYSAIPLDIDAVNLDYDTYKYQSDGTTVGGEGPYLKYELVQSIMNNEESTKHKFFKDDEIYRIGIQFYNKVGQTSFVKWISDFKSPIGNLTNNYNTLKVELKVEFYTWLSTTVFEENEKPIGYKIMRADRTLSDMTILCQGSLNSTMSNTTDYVGDAQNDFLNVITKEKYIKGNKLPSLQRIFNDDVYPMLSMQDGRKLDPHSEGNVNPNGGGLYGTTGNREVIKAASSSDWRSDTYQFNKLIQLYSPEVLFSTVALSNGNKFRIIGGHASSENYYWGQERRVAGKDIVEEGKVTGGISPHADGVTLTSLNGTVNNLLDNGIFAPSGGEEDNPVMEFNQFFREFKGGFIPSVNRSKLDLYGAPELTERGQGLTYYNNNPDYNYYNSLQPMITDQNIESDNGQNGQAAITSVNSFGAKCITLMQGSDEPTTPLDNRMSLEQLYTMSSIGNPNSILLAEIVIPDSQIYLGNIYGGSSFESKKRGTYLEIGQYMKIEEGTANILSPGDTFVQDFKLLKLAKTETEVYSNQSQQFSEIIEYKIESTIDLKNRNDLSISSWESRFQPRDDEYHEYNRVYSQQPTLIQNVNEDLEFKKVNNFDTRIIASKVKVPGENIDSWTDFLVNETQDLDGKYGPINSLVNFKDGLYTLQDEGVAAISINPRVQVQAEDGLSLELGTGRVLYNYNYLTTKSGSINKWSTISTNSGFYYYDGLNNSWNRFTGRGIEGLTDKHGFHSFFNESTIYDDIKIDNPLLQTGAVSGYNPITNDVYLTILQGIEPFTICFNEMTDSFTSFYDYKPSMYIIKGFRMITPNSNNTELWEHFKGEYNSFYGTKYDSSITYMVNPQDRDCVFNNIQYKSEMSLAGVDVPKETLTHIRAYNEYLETAETPLVLNSNINRKFRMWRANIPRALNNGNPSLDRMRGHWVFLELTLKPDDNNYKMILHDMNVNYTAYQY